MSNAGAGYAGPNPPRVYLDWGLIRSGGIQNSIIEANAATRGNAMQALLRSEFGYNDGHLHVVIDPNGDHSESAWGHRVGAVLTWFFGSPG